MSRSTPDLLEQLAGISIADGYDGGFVECITHTTTECRIDERARADRTNHDGRVRFMREQHLAEVHVGVAVIQDAAAAEYEEIEASHDLLSLST